MYTVHACILSYLLIYRMGGMDDRDRPPMPARQSQVDLMRRLDDFSLRGNAAHLEEGRNEWEREGGASKLACCFQGPLLGSRNNVEICRSMVGPCI